MSEHEVPKVRETLDRVRDSAEVVFESLLEPYEALARADPSAALGAPTDMPRFAPCDAVKQVVEEAARHGKGAWSLNQVEERQRQICDLLDEYKKGLYRETTVADWVLKVKRFRDAVWADLNTALQAPKGFDRVNLLGNDAAAVPGFDKELLTSKDVAAELKLGTRTVRRHIQEGKLGPWRKQGSKWVISREEFLRFWADRLLQSDSDVPRPPATNPADPDERLVHVRLKP